MAVGFVWHERFMWHDTGHAVSFVPSGGFLQPDEHVESPESKRRLRNLLEVSGILDHLVAIPPTPATTEQVERVHTAEYLRCLAELSGERGGPIGENVVVGPGSYDIALLAAGGVIAATESVLEGKVSSAYALVRPPGHHAEPDEARGFCLINNVSVAVKHALASGRVKRVAVVDFDVHHGNGTQKVFYDDPHVLTISVHQDNNYPQDSGAVDERGEGAGRGFNINIPLPPGSGRGAYRDAFDRVVVPALDAFAPELIFLSAGYDASAMDPLAQMLLYSDVYRYITAAVMGAADRHADGRLIACHEGGYSAAYVPFCGLAVIETLAGRRTDVVDPFGDWIANFGGQDLQPHQQQLIDKVLRVLDLACFEDPNLDSQRKATQP